MQQADEAAREAFRVGHAVGGESAAQVFGLAYVEHAFARAAEEIHSRRGGHLPEEVRPQPLDERARRGPEPELARAHGSAQGDVLHLPAAAAQDDEPGLAHAFVVGPCDAEVVGAALEAFGVEPAEGAFRRGAGRLVIFAADEPAGGVHGRTLAPGVGHPWGAR